MNQTSWTPNDYSNIITIGAAAVGSVMLILFKSKCSNIKLCCGLLSCDREVAEEKYMQLDSIDVANMWLRRMIIESEGKND